MSSIGNSGARSSGPTGWPVPGCSGGGIGVGRSGMMLYHWVGISDSSRMILVRSATPASRSQVTYLPEPYALLAPLALPAPLAAGRPRVALLSRSPPAALESLPSLVARRRLLAPQSRQRRRPSARGRQFRLAVVTTGPRAGWDGAGGTGCPVLPGPAGRRFPAGGRSPGTRSPADRPASAAPPGPASRAA